MAGLTFPSNLKTEETKINTPVSSSFHNSQIDTLEARDQFMLDFLSTFDAIPIGTILPTTIPYTSESDMPDGWVWADGRELSGDEYPKLWSLVKDAAVTVSNYNAWCTAHNFVGGSDSYTEVPRGFYVITNGSRDDATGIKFRIPNLRGVYIRSIGNYDEDRYLQGEYLNDTVGNHTHDVTAYPTNGVRISANENDIGVALTDQINTRYANHSEDYFTSRENSTPHITVSNTIKQLTSGGTIPPFTLPNETRPKSIAYRFMLKVEFKNPFTDGEGNVSTDANTVEGYSKSIESPFKRGNNAEKLFPIADPVTGQLDTSWIDVSYVTNQVSTNLSSNLSTLVSSTAIVKDQNIEGAVTATQAPVVGSKTVPVSDADGKLDLNYLPLTTNQQIDDTMFPDL